MNNLDKQYQALLQDILDNGVRKDDRTGTGTLSVFGRQIRHKMSEGFPLLTTKKMYFKGIVTELLWFLRGDTNIKYLVDNDCHIWDGDAYKAYQSGFKEKHHLKPTSTKEEFIERIKTDDEFAKKWGELGPVYGKQWREWTYLTREQKQDIDGIDEEICGADMWDGIRHYRTFDQIANLINDLKTNPDSRRLMVNAWNVGELDQMTLPPCHYGFQVYTRELSLEERVSIWDKKFLDSVKPEESMDNLDLDHDNIPTRAISLMWNQRSVDTFLGLPFNIASYGLLLEIIAKEVNMVPDELIGNLGDTHLYANHIEQAKEQIGEIIYEDSLTLYSPFHKDGIQKKIPIGSTREPYPLPKLMICGDMRRTDGFIVPFDELDHSLIKLIDYQSHPTIKAPLSN
jgi:thymidylate synthase